VKVRLEALGQNIGEHPEIILPPFHVNDSSLFDRIDYSNGSNVERMKEGLRDDEQLALYDFKLLTHPEDVDVMVKGYTFRYSKLKYSFRFRKVVCNSTFTVD